MKDVKDIIKSAWGPYWELISDHADIDGWVNEIWLRPNGKFIGDYIPMDMRSHKDSNFDVFYFRPISLSTVKYSLNIPLKGWRVKVADMPGLRILRIMEDTELICDFPMTGDTIEYKKLCAALLFERAPALLLALREFCSIASDTDGLSVHPDLLKKWKSLDIPNIVITSTETL